MHSPQEDDLSDPVLTLSEAGESGLPSFSLPPFSLPTNSTDGHTDLSAMLINIGPDLLIIPLIAVIETVAIAKSFGNTSSPLAGLTWC